MILSLRRDVLSIKFDMNTILYNNKITNLSPLCYKKENKTLMMWGSMASFFNSASILKILQ